MIERTQRFTGEVDPCPACGRQPIHVRTSGKPLADTLNFCAPSETHACECSPCGLRTPRMPTTQQALEHWARMSSAVAA